MQLNPRQEEILSIVKEQAPITGEAIADRLSLSRAALRSDLAVLTMVGRLEAKPRVGYMLKSVTENKLSAILAEYRVKDVRSSLVCIKETTSVYEAIVSLFLEDTGTLMVVDDAVHLVGIVSRKDLLKATLGQADIKQLPVSVIMTRMPNLVTITNEESVISAVQKLVEHELDSLPIVNVITETSGAEAFEVIGRVTKTSITRFFLELTYKK